MINGTTKKNAKVESLNLFFRLSHKTKNIGVAQIADHFEEIAKPKEIADQKSHRAVWPSGPEAFPFVNRYIDS
ncbi:MAG: hypothetical protein UT58_C0005G0001, partial [Microgenomates group bacterium GW2011_GWC1_39_7b]